jgi:UDP-N-acetylglucosamine transferase subunit ALG13
VSQEKGSYDVVVVVGTDHHPFDRLCQWVEEWAARRPTARCLIQCGTARTPLRVDSARTLRHDEVLDLMSAATAVVCHGGPGTIMDALQTGRVPIVVPRRHALGEHIDDHQVAFTRRFAQAGRVRLAETAEELWAALDAAMTAPQTLRTAPALPASASIDRLADVIAGLAPGRAGPDGQTPPVHGAEVLFVAGWGRSGSTLLDRILGQLDGVFSVGETRDIWERGVDEDRLCGCGEPFSGCPFWQKVGDVAFGGWSALDVALVQGLRRYVDRPWNLPLLLRPGLRPAFDRRADEYATYLSRLYRGVAEVSGARVVVESGKIATYALLLQRAGLPLRVVHLVRDSRGVLYSWRKRVQRPDSTSVPDQMISYGVIGGSARYLGYNLMAAVLARGNRSFVRLRYEDLVADPVHTLRAITTPVGLVPDPAAEAALADGRVTLLENHTVDGNPMRLTTGEIVIRRDDEWRRQMGRRERLAVTLLTAPLLARYGYLGEGARS